MGKQRTKTRVHQRDHVTRKKQPEFSIGGPEVAPPPFLMDDSQSVSILDIEDSIQEGAHLSKGNHEEQFVEDQSKLNEMGNPIFGSPGKEMAQGAHVMPESLTQIPQADRSFGEDFSQDVDFEAMEGMDMEQGGFDASGGSDGGSGEGGQEGEGEGPEGEAEQKPSDGAPEMEGGQEGEAGGQEGGAMPAAPAAKTSQAAPGGGEAASLFGGNQSVNASNGSANTMAPLATGAGPDISTGENGAAAVTAFISEMQGKRSAIAGMADAKKASIMSAASAQKSKITSSIEAKAAALEAAYQSTLAKISSSAQETKAGIESGKAEKIGAVESEAATQLAAVESTIATKKAAMIQAGEAKANAALQGGQKEAQRAINETKARANKALLAGSKGKFSGFKRADRIAAVVGKMAAEAANKMMETGAKVVEAVQKDAKALADKFKKEAKEAAAKFDEGKSAAVDKINQEKESAVQQINESATEAVAKVGEAESKAKGDLQGQSQAPQTLRQLASQSAGSIDQLASAACSQIDQQAQGALSEIDGFISNVASELQGASEEEASGAISQARAGFDAQYSQFSGALDSGASTVIGEMSKAGSDVVSRAESSASQIQSTVTETGSSFASSISEIKTTTLSAMDENANNAKTEMGKAVTTLDTELTKAINESTSTWEGELTQGLQEIKGKVDKVIAEQESLQTLQNEIDKKAQEIENESWLSRTMKFIGGMIVGFVKALVEMVVMILVIALVVLAIVAVIAALIYLIGGLGALLAVVLFLAANAALIGSIITVITTVMTVVGLVIAAYNIYQAATRSDLSDYERGKLAGQGLFDIVETAFGGKLWGGLGDLGKGLLGMNKAADASKLGNVGDVAKLGDASDVGKAGDLGDLGKIDGPKAPDAPKGPDAAPKAPEAAPKAPEAGPKAPEGAPKAPEAAPKAPESAPKGPEAGPKAPEAAPKAPEAAPKAPESAPKAPEGAPKAPEAGAPKAPESAPKAPETVKGPETPGSQMDGMGKKGPTPENTKPVSGRGRRGGQKLKKKDMAKLKSHLEGQGIESKVVPGDADKVKLQSGKEVAFPTDKQAAFYTNAQGDKVLILRENATFFEAFHEMMHMKHAQDIGFDEYLKIGLGKPKAVRELDVESRVFDMIIENKEMFTKGELDSALSYINRVRGKNGLDPLTHNFDDIPNILKERKVQDLFTIGKEGPKNPSFPSTGSKPKTPGSTPDTPSGSSMDAMPKGPDGPSVKPEGLSGPSSAAYDKLTGAGMTAKVDGGNVSFYTASGKKAAEMVGDTLVFKYAGHGGDIVMDPSKTTTFLGKFDDGGDLDAGTRFFLGSDKPFVEGLPEGSFSRGVGDGTNPNGMNSLDLPNDEYMAIINRHMEIQKNLPENAGLSAKELESKGWQAGNEEFWKTYNEPFLEDAFIRGDNVRLLSDPKTKATGMYGRELDMINGPDGLAAKYGYYYDEAAATYKKGTPPKDAHTIEDGAMDFMDDGIKGDGLGTGGTPEVKDLSLDEIKNYDGFSNPTELTRHLDNLETRATTGDKGVTPELLEKIRAEVGFAIQHSQMEDSTLMSYLGSISSAKGKTQPTEFFSELFYANQNLRDGVVQPGTSIKIGKTGPDDAKNIDLGGGRNIELPPNSEADALFFSRDGNDVWQETKNTAQALRQKLDKSKDQMERMIAWRGAGTDTPRVIEVNVYSTERITEIFSGGKGSAAMFLSQNNVPLRIGTEWFDAGQLATMQRNFEAFKNDTMALFKAGKITDAKPTPFDKVGTMEGFKLLQTIDNHDDFVKAFDAL